VSRNVKGNKKSFYKYVSAKRKAREKMGLLWKETGDLVTWDTEKGEVLNDILPQSSPASGEGRDCENGELPNVAEDQV